MRTGEALSDLPSWWAEGGRPGWSPGIAFGSGVPWTLAGHALGSWSLAEPEGAPTDLPWPGCGPIHTPLVWCDSVDVRLAEGAAWRGFGSALAVAEGRPSSRSAGKGLTVVDLRGGSHGFDENGLRIARGGERGWLAVEVMEGRLGRRAGFEQLGRHLWGLGFGLRRGVQELEAVYRQRGVAAALASTEEQSASGEGGHLQYRYRGDDRRVSIRVSRALDRRESFADFFDWSRRDAQGTRVVAEATQRLGPDALSARLAWEHARVARAGNPGEQFETGADVTWGALSYDRAAGAGTLRLGFGAGHHEAVAGFELAPSVAYEVGGGSVGARMALERVLVPVWTDLAGGEEPFLQRTWAGVIEVRAEGPTALARVSAMLGHTTDRARVMRLPLEELWLREGVVRGPERHRFALATCDARVRRGGLELGVEGHAMARDLAEDEPAVDPGHTLRTLATWQFTAFGGDLGVTLQAMVDRVGARESEEFGVVGRALPGYWTAGASVGVTLAGATIVVRGRNLEDRPREEVWFDVDTGREALAPGREWLLAVTVRLLD